MTDETQVETPGEAIKRRRQAVGLRSQTAAAKASQRLGMGISRKSIIRAENDELSADSDIPARLELFYAEWQRRAEEERKESLAALDPTGADFVQYSVVVDGDRIEAIVKGPVLDADELRRQTIELVRETRRAIEGR